MGVLTRYLAADRPASPPRSLTASAAPSPMAPTASPWAPASLVWPQLEQAGIATREQALSVPTIARARNLIAGTIAELPLRTIDRAGAQLEPVPWIEQPDRHAPRAVTVAWTVEDLLLEGIAYWQVTEVYAEDGRPRRFQRLHPSRVAVERGTDGWSLQRLTVDGEAAPSRGLGRVVMFQGLDDGLLHRDRGTILTAVALERAARRYADEPLPAAVLKNKGANLTPRKIGELLEGWRKARRDGSVGYLSADVDLERMGWSAGELQLVEARQHLATELARAANLSPWWVGADTGSSLTYSNVTEERRSLLDYTLRPYLSVIEQRLTMPDVIAGPRTVRFAVDDWLRGDTADWARLVLELLAAEVVDVAEARSLIDLAPRGSEDPDA